MRCDCIRNASLSLHHCSMVSHVKMRSQLPRGCGWRPPRLWHVAWHACSMYFLICASTALYCIHVEANTRTDVLALAYMWVDIHGRIGDRDTRSSRYVVDSAQLAAHAVTPATLSYTTFSYLCIACCISHMTILGRCASCTSHNDHVRSMCQM